LVSNVNFFRKGWLIFCGLAIPGVRASARVNQKTLENLQSAAGVSRQPSASGGG